MVYGRLSLSSRCIARTRLNIHYAKQWSDKSDIDLSGFNPDQRIDQELK